MANAAPGKTNINVNIREITDQRIEEIQKLTFRTNKGDVIDLAVDELYARLMTATAPQTAEQ